METTKTAERVLRGFRFNGINPALNDIPGTLVMPYGQEVPTSFDDRVRTFSFVPKDAEQSKSLVTPPPPPGQERPKVNDLLRFKFEGPPPEVSELEALRERYEAMTNGFEIHMATLLRNFQAFADILDSDCSVIKGDKEKEEGVAIEGGEEAALATEALIHTLQSGSSFVWLNKRDREVTQRALEYITSLMRGLSGNIKAKRATFQGVGIRYMRPRLKGALRAQEEIMMGLREILPRLNDMALWQGVDWPPPIPSLRLGPPDGEAGGYRIKMFCHEDLEVDPYNPTKAETALRALAACPGIEEGAGVFF